MRTGQACKASLALSLLLLAFRSCRKTSRSSATSVGISTTRERERLCVLIDAEHLSKGSRVCAKCLPELGVTGCTFVPGRGYEYDRLGTDEPPQSWEYDRPSWREQLGALAGNGLAIQMSIPWELTSSTSAWQSEIFADRTSTNWPLLRPHGPPSARG
jgi:hypothetical protein